MCRVNNRVSNNGAVRRFCASFVLIDSSLSGCVAKSIADISYSSWLAVMSSGRSIALNKLAATLPAKVSPICVKTGNPAHKASLAVVCALQGKVSKNKSATRCRAKCSCNALAARKSIYLR